MKTNEVQFLEITSNDGDMISLDLEEQKELYKILKNKFEPTTVLQPYIVEPVPNWQHPHIIKTYPDVTYCTSGTVAVSNHKPNTQTEVCSDAYKGWEEYV